MELLSNDIGTTIEFGVLLLGGDGETTIGTPEIDGAKVVAEVIEHGRDKKILVFKYKNKTRYRRRHGHRRHYTRLQIKQIVTASGNVIQVEEKPRKPRRSQAEFEPEVEATEAASAVDAVETPVEEAPVAGAGASASRARSRASRAADASETEAQKPTRPRRAKARAEDEAPVEAIDEAPAEAGAADEDKGE